jgi:LPXTG-motif cell wall-anchored protein
LPKTASAQPLIALIGLSSLLLGLTLTIRRRLTH